MAQIKHKVFISHHHDNDQAYKDALLKGNDQYDIFIDGSVDIGEIDENLDDQAIREKIRDDYLQDSTVTVVLVGTETKRRKHVDWEIYSSMYDGKVNKKSGVLVINLPSTGCTSCAVAHGDEEKRVIYPDYGSWISVTNRSDWEARFPYMPDRIIDNLLKSGANVSVTYWDRFANDIEKLRYLIDVTFNDRAGCDYDLSRPLRRANS